jgi:hypothetical protein
MSVISSPYAQLISLFTEVNLDRISQFVQEHTNQNNRQFAEQLSSPEEQLAPCLKELFNQDNLCVNPIQLSSLTKEITRLFLNKYRLDENAFKDIIDFVSEKRRQFYGYYRTTTEVQLQFSEDFKLLSPLYIQSVILGESSKQKSQKESFEFATFGLSNSQNIDFKFFKKDSETFGNLADIKNAYHALQWIENFSNNIQFFILEGNEAVLIKYLEIANSALKVLRSFKDKVNSIDRKNQADLDRY